MRAMSLCAVLVLQLNYSVTATITTTTLICYTYGLSGVFFDTINDIYCIQWRQVEVDSVPMNVSSCQPSYIHWEECIAAYPDTFTEL